MNFELVLERLLEGYERLEIRYALMGGFALGALGAPRATMDLDFLVHHDDLKNLHTLMLALGYARRFHSENVSQYKNLDHQWGYVDFVHAFRKVSLGMLQRALEKPILHGTRKARVLEPEDVIGLKVQALANDPARKSKEVADIEALLELYGHQLDWARLSEYYRLFGLEDTLKGLKERFGHAN